MRLRSLLIISVAVLFFASCKKSNTQGRYIPKDAAIVLHLNGASLNEKLPWEEVKQSEFFKTLSQDTSLESYVKSALDNPDNTGIDNKKDLVFFIQKDSTGAYMALSGTVKDAEKFKSFSANYKGGSFSAAGDVSVLTHPKMAINWNKERFVIVFDAAFMDEMNNPGMRMNDLDEEADMTMATPARNLTPIASSLFSLKEDASLAKDDKFSKLMKNSGDVHFFMNMNSLNSGSAAMAAMSMMNFSKLYEGTYITGTTTFENGRIITDYTAYAGKELTELWKKYSGNSIDGDMVKRIPAQNVAVLLAMNFKPEGLREFIKLAGLEGFANMGAGMAGFTLDDVVNAFKGDFIIAVTDIVQDTASKTDANFIFSAAVKDKAAFAKIQNATKKLSEKNNIDDEEKIFQETKGDHFVLSNKKTSVDKYLAGGKSNFPFFDKISNSAMAAYVDFQYILKAIPVNATDSGKAEIHNVNVNMWDEMIMTGGKYSDGAWNQQIEISLIDKNVNSLKQLNRFFGNMALIEKKNKTISESIRNKQIEEIMEVPADTLSY